MDPLLAFILGFIAGWYVALFVWWMATRLCVRTVDMARSGGAAMRRGSGLLGVRQGYRLPCLL